MQICFMTHSVHPASGGSTKYFFEVTQETKKQGHHVTLICTAKASSKDIKVDDLVFVKQIPVPILGYLLQTLFFGLFVFLKVRRRDFDVYCFESGYLGIWAALFRLIKKTPLVSFSMRYGWNVLKATLRTKHLAGGIEGLLYVLWEICFFANEALDVRLSDKVIVLNKEAKEVWTDAGLAAAKVEVIPCGVNLDKFRPGKKDQDLLRELAIGEDDTIILFVGHLDPIRNIDKLVKAFPLLLRKLGNSEAAKNPKLIIVGSGILEESLRRLVDELGLEQHVRFIRHIGDETKLSKVYNLGDLLVLPQVPGVVALEATACGLPVVTLQNKAGLLGAVDERILSNFTLLDSADPEKLATACYELLRNPQTLDNSSKRGLDLIAGYSWKNVARMLIAFLEETVGQDHKVRT